jgi:hypothetical protein
MSKAILEFDLSDPDDKDDYRAVKQARELLGCIEQFNEWLVFNHFKHRELSEKEQELLDEIREQWHYTKQDWDIHL